MNAEKLSAGLHGSLRNWNELGSDTYSLSRHRSTLLLVPDTGYGLATTVPIRTTSKSEPLICWIV